MQYFTMIPFLIYTMNAPSDWLDATHVSILESSSLEFKRSVGSATVTKISETLCAFLNTNTGTIVIGIDDTSRQIVGITPCKAVDTFLLGIDAIYHNGYIKTSDGKNLTIGTITVRTIVTKLGKSVITITATPCPDTRYQMADGTVWFRLAASNYRMSTPPTLHTDQEIERRVKQRIEAERVDFYRQLQSQTDTARSQVQKMKREFDALVLAAQSTERRLVSEVTYVKMQKQQLENDVSTMHSLVTTSILSNKSCIEKMQGEKKQTIWEWLFCL